MGVNVSEVQYKNFGKCVFLDNGIIKLGATVELGPRVIYFSLEGKENIMFEDVDRVFSEPVAGGEMGTWYVYGGHRLWCSPEVNPETYYPDNGNVDYKYENGVLTLSPAPTPFGKEFTMQIEMSPDKPSVKLTHKVKNISDKPSTFAAWSITSLAADGISFVPMSNKTTGYLPNRTISLWDFNDINDPRFTLANYGARLKQDRNAAKAFKLGFNSEDGFIACSVNGQLFIETFKPYEEGVNYPDFGCNVETYTNSLFIECESLGEIRAFAPGETAEISETWHLGENITDFNGDMDKIRAELVSYAENLRTK